MFPGLFYLYGAMGCGKTAKLIENALALKNDSTPCIVLKPSTDDRDGYGVTRSRNGMEIQCSVINQIENLQDVSIAVEHILRIIHDNGLEPENGEVDILVDEAQFLNPIYVDAFAYIADTFDSMVMCYGLRTDFKGNMFPGSKRLFELADNVAELHMKCARCDGNAVINARLSDGNIVTDGPQVMVGGDETYVPLCRKCYMELAGTHNSEEHVHGK